MNHSAGLTGLGADARAIYAAAVAGARPDRLFAALDPGDALPPAVSRARRVVVAGAGKGAMLLAGVVEATLVRRGLPPGSLGGIVTVPHGYRAAFPADAPLPRAVEVVEAGHPVPDAAGAAAAERVLHLAGSLGTDDVLLALVSGGASALWPAFVAGVSLDDARRAFGQLLRSGADIHAVNTVRRHLSRIGGGWLAARASPATVHALVLSDVVGDDLAVIGSGPTVPDPTTFADAAHVLRAHGLWNDAPDAVRSHLDRGVRASVPETPKPGDPRLAGSRTVLLGTNAAALAAAASEAARRGYRTAVVTRDVTGEARDVGRRQAGAIVAAAGSEPVCLLWGGETTVTVRGTGRGGRNQELALAAGIALDGAPHECLLLSAGTDGVDGPTDAAGAWATERTVREARARGLDADASLANNDAYALFDALGALLRTGPTHTNVMDLQVAVAGRT